MNATELRRMKRLLSSTSPEEQLSGVCIASYAAASFKSGREPQLQQLASAFSSAASLDWLLHALKASFGEHTKVIHTAAVDVIGMLAVVREPRQLFTQVELTPEMWTAVASLPSSPLLQEGTFKFLSNYARSLTVNRLQTLMHVLEQVVTSDTIAEEYTPAQILHAATTLLAVADAIQHDEQQQQQQQQQKSASQAVAIADMVCQNQSVTAKLRKMCMQTMYGAAQNFVRDEAIRCCDTLLRILGSAWTVEPSGAVGEFVSLLVAVVRGELHLLLEELLYWASGSTYEEHTAAVEAEKESRSARFALLGPVVGLFELFVAYLCGEQLVEYTTVQPSWEALPTDRLLHIQQSLHQSVSSLCDFIGNARRVTPIKQLAPVLARTVLRAAKAVCNYALEDESPEIQEKATKMITDLNSLLSESEGIDDMESMLALVDGLLETDEDAILVGLMFPPDELA